MKEMCTNMVVTKSDDNLLLAQPATTVAHLENNWIFSRSKACLL